MFERKEPLKDNFKEVRRLAREFKCVDSTEIGVLLQFCQNSEEHVRKILTVFQSMHKPGHLIQEMLEHPEKSDEMIGRYLELYAERHEKEFERVRLGSNHQKYSHFPSEKLSELPTELVFEIALFLQPNEMVQFMGLKPHWAAMFKQSRARIQDYYGRICRVLFSSLEPCLPASCMFDNIRQYVLTHPREFTPNIRNYIESNVREYVWQVRPMELRLASNYFRSMGSFENIYNLCPRVHFNGCYVLREKYVRPVEHGINMCVQKYNVIYYYRYIRFVPDGSVLYTFSNTKLRNDELADKLSLKRFDDETQTIKGEYMQHKEKLMFKIARCNTVFSFDCIIQTEESLFDTLLINTFNLEIVDQHYIVQDVYRDKHKEKRIFKYFQMQELARQNPLSIQSASL